MWPKAHRDLEVGKSGPEAASVGWPCSFPAWRVQSLAENEGLIHPYKVVLTKWDSRYESVSIVHGWIRQNSDKTSCVCWAWWHIPVFLALQGLRQGDWEFEAVLSYCPYAVTNTKSRPCGEVKVLLGMALVEANYKGWAGLHNWECGMGGVGVVALGIIQG